ncbi:hypothetical protein Tco_1026236 [Tanacetum coccineum]
MGCCLTSWFSKKQTALAISMTEAEYVSARKASQQALWMKQALIDYNIRLDDIPIMCDNKGAIDLSKNPKSVFEESINVLNLEVKLRDNALIENKKKLEKAKKKRDELKLTLEKFQNSSKSLNNLLESQVVDMFKTRLGYNAASSTIASPAVEIPPPFTGNFIPFKPNLTFMDEIVESENMDVTTTVTPSNVKKVESNHESAGVKSNCDAVERKTIRKNNFRPSFIKDWNSDDESEREPKKLEQSYVPKTRK